MVDYELTKNEKFWIDVIRRASKARDPMPTLWRAQQFRRIIEQDTPKPTPWAKAQ